MMKKKRIDVKYVKQLQRGDLKGFDKINEFYKDALFYFIVSLVHNHADAEDVIQDTFIQAVQKIQQLKDPESFHAWLYRIAYNNSMLVYQKKANHIDVSATFDFDNVSDQQNKLEHNYNEKELIQAVSEELNNLPDRFSQVAQLRYLDDLTTREISEILEIPEGTVKTRLKKTRELIQPSLEKKGYTPTKYFSLGGAALMFRAYELLAKKHAMSEVEAELMYRQVFGIIKNLVPITSFGAAKIGLGIIGSSGIFFASATFGMFVYEEYKTKRIEGPVIEEVSYNNEYTNKNLDVEVLVRDGKEKDVSIKYKEKNLDFVFENGILNFQAKENGVYTIEANGNKEIFEITNIDKEHPVLEQIIYEEERLKFVFGKDQTKIDYDESYVQVGDQVLHFNIDGVLEGHYEGNITIYLYDGVGNMAEYSTNLS